MAADVFTLKGNQMRYGFTPDGFVAVDDALKIGEFAYATSPYWEQARRNPEQTAATMLAKSWREAPQHIREQHYALSCDSLARS
jgi:hypothetical protein